MQKYFDNKLKFPIIIFIFALTLRVIYVFVPAVDYFNSKNPVKFMSYEQDNDAGNYVRLANGLLRLGYPALEGDDLIMNGGLLYPLLLSLNLLISQNLILIILLQVLLDSLICVLLYTITLKITKSEKPAIFSALMYALYYPNFNYPARILTESIYTFLIIFGVYWIFAKKNKFGSKEYAILGAIFSAAALTRAMIFYVFLIILFSVFIIRLINHKKNSYKLVYALIAFFIIQIPWLIIGYSHTEKIVFSSTGGGIVLATGTYLPALGDHDPVYRELYPENPVNVIENQAEEYKYNTAQKDSAYKSIAFRQIINNIQTQPAKTIKVALFQLSRFWLNMPFYNPPSNVTYLIALINIALLIFAFITFLRYRKNGVILMIFGAFIIYQLLHSVTFNLIRYSAPLMPIVILFASTSIYSIFSSLYKKVKTHE